MAYLFLLVICSFIFNTCCYAATKHFSIEVTWATRAPDGVPRQQILLNGQSPGPTLVVDQGDEVEVLAKEYYHIRTRLIVSSFSFATS